MSNPNALYLLADHIKLSLLERKRAQTLNLDSDSQDGHLSRSLEQFKDGLEALAKEQKRLEESGNDAKASTIADALPELQKQFDDLTSQFHGFSTPSTAQTLTSPNDPTLAADFAHATSTTSPTAAAGASTTDDLAASTASSTTGAAGTKKSVRFSDVSPRELEAQTPRGKLLPYRDDPDAPVGYRDRAEAEGMSNEQIHAYHEQILSEQDAQLDALGASISRQRELSMQMGDELDEQVMMLDESDRAVDRHQGRLDRARRQVGRVARGAGENKQMVAIVVLIVVLILLIALLK